MITVSEAAARMNVHENTVYRYISEGQIRAVKLPGGHWRIDESTLPAVSGDE